MRTVFEGQTSLRRTTVLQVRGERSRVVVTYLLWQIIVHSPISHPSIPGIYHSPFPGQKEHRSEIESSDRRLRDTDETF